MIWQLYRQADSLVTRRPLSILKLPATKAFSTMNNKTGILKGGHLNLNRTQLKLSTGMQSRLAGVPCLDTSVRLIYRKDSNGFSNDFITKTRDGNILIPGFEFNTGGIGVSGHLIKCTQQGDTLWSKVIKGGYPNGLIEVYRAFELNDNSILLIGDISVPMPYNGRNDPMIMRVSATGNLMWEKTFKTKVWNVDTTSGSVYIIDCKQDANGDMYLCGAIRTDALPRVALTFKMDLAGNILWSKGYYGFNFPTLTGVNLTNQKATFLGRAIFGNSIAPIALVADAATGDTLRTTSFTSPTGDFWHTFYSDNMVKLNNGNLALYGAGISDGSDFDTTQFPTHAGMLEITPDLEFVQSNILRSRRASNSYNTVITVFDDGSAAYTRLNYITGWNGDVIYGSYNNGQILKERMIPYRGLGIVWASNFLRMDDGGQIITNFIGDSVANINYIEFMKLHNSDTSGSCLGNETATTFVEKQYFYNSNLYFDSIATNVLTEELRPFDGIYNNNFIISSNCKQVSFCDSLKLTTAKDTICVNNTVNITLKRNKECGAMPLWSYDTTAVSSFYKVDDTTMAITYNKVWQGNIMATIEGCKTLQDSVHFTVLQAPSLLDIGTDTVICDGNTILLNAKNGYASYKWQDGSVDSTFMVTAPGKYYVRTTDACGGIFSDSVTVSSHAPTLFNIGPDTSICKYDSIGISAPPGFIHYQWTSYNISSDTSQDVKIFPLINSWYKVIAEKTPGCFASDSLFVTVKNVLAINLGNDTSFCINQPVTFDAGPGFNTYLWNTGAATEKITANQQGTFSIKAMLNGCFSYDTVKILNVYALPSFSLGNDTALCEGQQLSFTFNLPQASYKWSTESFLNTQTIRQPGMYWLEITQKGCVNSDTVNVIYNASPVINLGNDTTLCERQILKLNAFTNNATYHWQDGSAGPSYTVKNAGEYYVIASSNSCTDSDTIVVSYKALPYFTLGKDSFLCTGQQLVLHPLFSSAVDLMWQNGSTSPLFTVDKEGTYILKASNECGNYSDSVNITTGICNLIMPSAFTPNQDGINDVFKVKYPFPVQQFKMRIYNRWGQKIFESENINLGWDGKGKGEIALEDTYVWIIDYADINNKQQQLKGTVTLIR